MVVRRAAVAAVACLLGGAAANAQNLVVNPSFELYSQCPSGIGVLTNYVDDWYRTGLGSTDYQHTCGFSGTTPRTGEGHVGLIPFDSSPDYREYLTGRLATPLTAGQTYRVEFWVLRNDGRLHAIQEMSAWLTPTPPTFVGSGSQPTVMPQVTHSGGVLEDAVDWQRVSESFVAAGGEEYVTIGNFLEDADTTTIFYGCCGSLGAYYHLDDVSLVLESAAPQLAVSCARIGDRCDPDPALDADGLLDFGEEVDVELTVENVGTVDVTGWSGTLAAAGAEVLDPPGGLLEVASLPVGASVALPATLRIPLESEGAFCGQLVDLSLEGQVADGGFTFPDAPLSACDAVADGCRECRPTCLYRVDVTSLLPHVPARADAYRPRDARDVALTGAAYACPFADGDLEPDPAALGNGLPLVLYQVDRPVDTLRLEPAGATVRFRF